MTAQLFDFPAPAPIQPKIKRAKPRKSSSYSEEFEAKIWSPYPRKLNCSKLMAFRAWEQLPDESRDQAIAALPVFARSCVGKDEGFIPHCATWLNQRRFETVVVPAPKCSHPVKVDWSAIMRLYGMTSNWKQENGPPPGEPGCLVPAEFIGEMT